MINHVDHSNCYMTPHEDTREHSLSVAQWKQMTPMTPWYMQPWVTPAAAMEAGPIPTRPGRWALEASALLEIFNKSALEVLGVGHRVAAGYHGW